MFFLKKLLNIKKRKNRLKIARAFSLLELLVVLSLLSLMIVVGSRYVLKKNPFQSKLETSSNELIVFLNHIYATSLYSGSDILISIKKDDSSGFIFETYFMCSTPLNVRKGLKRKLHIKNLDSISFNSVFNDEINWFFDGFSGKTPKGILTLHFKQHHKQISLVEFPIKAGRTL